MAPPMPKSPAPVPSAWLLTNALLLTVSVAPPKLSMPPPTLPPKKEPPPPPRAWLPLKVEESTVAVPSLSRAPPKTSTVSETAVAVLPAKTSRFRVRVEPASLRTPPPPRVAFSSPVTLPLATVKSVRVTVAPLLTSKTRLAWLPLTVSLSAPGPSMVRLCVMSNCPLVSVMSWTECAKTMVSPL